MARNKTDLTGAVGGLLSDYVQLIGEELQGAIRAAAKEGVKKLKKTAPRSSGSGSMGKHYADQWAVREEVTRVTARATVYNKAPTYRLAHLLENGYAKRNGGRVQGRPHIKPVEEMITDEVMEAVRKAAEG